MYNDYMYGVERNEEFLAHYGIRGMKWGVRKAIKSGNSARLSRQYAKASKKLAKLEKRAANSSKYAKRAALMGAGAAAAGGLAALGTKGVGVAVGKAGTATQNVIGGVGSGMNKAGHALGRFASNTPGLKGKTRQLLARGARTLESGGNAVSGVARPTGHAMRNAGQAVQKWGMGNSIGNAASKKVTETWNGYARSQLLKGTEQAYRNVGKQAPKARGLAKNLSGVSNNTIARVAAGAVGAGLAAGAAKNAYRAATAKKKAAKFKSEMNKAFAGTKYANGGQPRQGKKRRR